MCLRTKVGGDCDIGGSARPLGGGRAAVGRNCRANRANRKGER